MSDPNDGIDERVSRVMNPLDDDLRVDYSDSPFISDDKMHQEYLLAAFDLFAYYLFKELERDTDE